MTCTHASARIEWPGGYAVQTARGSWTAYYEDRPGQVFCITSCPVCLLALPSRRDGERPTPNLPSAAYSAAYRRRHGIP